MSLTFKRVKGCSTMADMNYLNKTRGAKSHASWNSTVKSCGSNNMNFFWKPGIFQSDMQKEQQTN